MLRDPTPCSSGFLSSRRQILKPLEGHEIWRHDATEGVKVSFSLPHSALSIS